MVFIIKHKHEREIFLLLLCFTFDVVCALISVNSHDFDCVRLFIMSSVVIFRTVSVYILINFRATYGPR